MSHFKVAVITDSGTKEELKQALQPYHEFECTGIVDKYVLSLDVTEEARSDYKEWGQEYNSFEDFLIEEKSIKVASQGGLLLDLEKKHKFGYYLLDSEGEVSHVVERTNPNKKWDWWLVGGRFSDSLLTHAGKLVDSAQIKDIDFKGKSFDASHEAGELYREFHQLFGKFTEGFKIWEIVRDEIEDIDKAREIYHAQPLVVKMYESENFKWLKPNKFVLNSEEEYKNQEGSLAITPFALVVNGHWYEKGSMGWFACISDEKENWVEIYNEQLAKVDPEKYYTIVDCHI